MKLSFLWFCFFMISSIAHAYELKTIDGKIVFAKYIFNWTNEIIWDDEQRDKIIFTSVDTGTGSAKMTDFTSIIDTDTQQQATEIEEDGMKLSKTEVETELRFRQSLSSNDKIEYRKMIRWVGKNKK